jgi:deazaflavin-dependent oxidoreductase (nitroreductase family)
MPRFILNLYSKLHVLIYRLAGGRIGGQVIGLHVLLLTTIGRKSGKVRTVPLGYFEGDGGYIIIASNTGADVHPAWFYNLQSGLPAQIQIKNQVIPVRAEVVSGPERSRYWEELIRRSPRYAGYQKRTARQIPLVMLRPVQD